MVCLLFDSSFLVTFVTFDLVLLGYFHVRLYMGLFSIVFFFGFPFCLLDFGFVLPGFHLVWGAQEVWVVGLIDF